ANDTVVRNAASEFAVALKRYALEYGTPRGFGSASTAPIDANGNCTGGVNAGWAEPGTYKCTIADILIAKQLLPANFFASLPKSANANNSPTTVFMFYPCATQMGFYKLMYTQYNTSSDVASTFDSVEKQCGQPNPTSDTLYTTYGMRGAILIDMN
ncbi:MAG TPA: hypothetical protein VFQ70_00475, partial [Candidatus Saccharimonadaceae bacterium]|nr:hypothetical protein [Candidatus Saccharimonadaceae bacterium]